MKTLKFNSDETFELWYALRHAINHEKANLKDWEALNKEGGFKSMIEETTKKIDSLERLMNFVTYCDEIKIEGD